jgi:hypothetical protein
MEKIKKTDTLDMGPISLDQEQLDELDKLIGTLKKEIIHPELKGKIKSAALKELSH